MENASKALIIAGAILITLIIIGLGVAILGSTEGATDTSTFDAMQVSSFNNKFKPYEGTINGSKLESLIDILIANARSEGDQSKVPDVNLNCPQMSSISKGTGADSNLKDVKFDSKAYIKYLKDIKEKIQSSERYEIKLTIDGNTDLVNDITIIGR